MRSVITGASGLIGQQLISALASAGHDVVPLGRTTKPAFHLGEPLPAAALDQVDVVIHSAWDFGAQSAGGKNVVGTRQLLDAAVAASVKRTIIISTMSAAESIDSAYGVQKRLIEDLAAERGALVVRPGLVWTASGGGGGLVEGIRAASRFPVVPVPHLPDSRLHLVEAGDLADVVLRMTTADAPPMVTVAHPEPLAIADIVRRAGAARGRIPAIAPIPAGVCMVALAAGRRLGFPFTTDNLRGLIGARAHTRLDAAPCGVSLKPFGG